MNNRQNFRHFQLTLIRHAKSSWKQTDVNDHQRPLAKRGKRDIPLMIENNSKLLSSVDHYYCSSAVRAKSIAEVITHRLEINQRCITINDSFYTFSSLELLKLIKNFSNSHISIAIIAHNPALTDLIGQLTQIDIFNLPTTGIARIRFAMDSWSDISTTIGKLVYLDCPKNYS